jgi:NADH-quinone oxidoreductase subunit G
MAAKTQMAQLTIDGHEIEVPAGMGLVEAAQLAGIEIPVFCYEPRIGPPVGACRMCLVEIEGMPKLQTGCTTTVRDGMVVSSAGKKARDAQEAVLEFLLINHPLDCPVCDKGGECPLQDQAYRWGPGDSRFQELKRNNDKPIPISPLIALDRERCILCYRCTRFSDEVSGDRQLIARERGASSVIATFEGRPYAGHFSGNIVELCPVGALTSTEYRFKARPWDAQDHPTVCGTCSVGCNTFATVREGAVQRVLARENVAVDEGWLCDRGRFAYPSLYAPGRIVRPGKVADRNRPLGNSPVLDLSWEGALEELHAKLSLAGEPATWVLGGGETLEIAWAVQQVAAASGGRVVSLGASAAGPDQAASATIADVSAARHVLVVGDTDLADDAPILDLRVRKALKAEASVTIAGIGGTRLEPAGAHLAPVAPGGIDAWVADHTAKVHQMRAGADLTEPGVVIYRDGQLSAESIAALTEAYQLTREGSGLVAIPRAANARGLAALGIESVTLESLGETPGGLVLVGVDLDREYAPEVWAPALRRSKWVVCVDAFPSPVHAIADLVVPATMPLEREGTMVNLEGRLQRLSAAAPAPEEIKAELSWLAGLARRFGRVPSGRSVPGYSAGAFRMLAAEAGAALPAKTYADIPEDGVLGVRGAVAALPVDTAADGEGDLTIFVAPFLYDAAEVAHTKTMDFLNEAAWLTLARDDANERGLQRGDEATVRIGEHVITAKVAVSRRVAAGHARLVAGAPGVPSHLAGYRAATFEATRELAGAR